MAAVLGVGLLAIASPAYAADRSDLINRDSITIVNKSGSDPNAPLNQWNQTEISFDFSSQGKAKPAPGDTFSLKLPNSFRTSAITFDLKDDNGVTLGSCTTTGGDGSTVTCTLNENVADREFVEGSVWLDAQASKQVSEETVDFDINGEVVPVDLPGEGGIGPEDTVFPQEPAKWGWFTGPDRKNIVWSLFIPGDSVGSDDPLVIVDQLGPNQRMVDGWVLESQNAPGKNEWSIVASSSGDTRGVTMAINDGADGFTLSIPKGLFESGTLYRVQYVSQTTTSAEGEVFDNTATFQGKDVKSKVTRKFEGGGDINGPGFGSVGVQKLAIAGEGASAVPADTKFTVNATYEVDGEPVTKEVTLTAGGAAQTITNLPTGTVVTLSEIKLPEVAGLEWGDPKFSGEGEGVTVSADGKSVQVTVQEQKTVTVSLTNTASPVTTTTPPPTTTPPTTTPPVTPPTTTTPPTETTPPTTTPPTTTPPVTPPTTTAPVTCIETPSTPAPGTSGPSQPGTSTPAGGGDNCESGNGGTTAKPDLAQTGSNLGTLGGIAAGLVVAGGAVLLASRRREDAAK